MALDDKDHPKTIGKYEIRGILGRGAMGVVYKGFDPKIERLVAIKTVRTDLLVGEDGEDWLARFSREARAAGRCLHPNIVALFDYDQHEGMPFIAMEYVEGREVADIFKEGGRFEQDQALDIVHQVLSALDYAHDLGIVHRDIKPANIILVDDGTVKVTDFGIARLDTVNLTQHGSMIGTPSYMSPEQFTGQTVDRRSDLFSCGVLLFELLTGEKPFAGTTMTEVMYKVLHEHPRELSDVNRFTPAALNDVVRKALAKEADERFQSAEDFLTALETAMNSDSLESTALLEPDSETAATLVAARTQPDSASPAESPLTSETAILRSVEEDLAVYMGPIAKVLVSKAAKKAQTPEELADRLARAIPDQTQSDEFEQRVKRTLGRISLQGPTLGSAVNAPSDSLVTEGTLGNAGEVSAVTTAALTEDDLIAAERGLAEILGPIAKIMVKKAVKTCTSVDQLYEELSENLQDETERRAFFATKPRL